MGHESNDDDQTVTCKEMRNDNLKKNKAGYTAIQSPTVGQEQ